MRIRQAHALITAAQTLEALDIAQSDEGYKFFPFDRDNPENIGHPDDDYITGSIEFPTYSAQPARNYDIELRPGPDDRSVIAEVRLDRRPGTVVFHQYFQTRAPADSDRFANTGQLISDAVAAAVRDHEIRLTSATTNPPCPTQD